MNIFTKRLLWVAALAAATVVGLWLLGMAYVLTD